MKKVLIVLEQGSNFGHSTIAVSLANLLREKSWECVIAAPSHHLQTNLIQQSSHRWVSIPEFKFEGMPRSPTNWKSYATMMWDLGGTHTNFLSSLFSTYHELFAREQPDVLVLNSAPFAHLASLTLDIARVHIGIPFDFCPNISPIPVFGQNQAIDSKHSIDLENRLQTTLTKSLGLSSTLFACFADMLQPAQSIVLSLPELDPQVNSHKQYVGSALKMHFGEPAYWRSTGSHAIAYLRSKFVNVIEVASLLDKEFDESLFVCPDIDPAELAALNLPNIHVSNTFINISELMHDCDVLVSHASGLSIDGVLNGVRQIVIPTQLEQSITARMLAQHGLALVANSDPSNAVQLIARTPLLTTPVKTMQSRYRHLHSEGSQLIGDIFRML